LTKWIGAELSLCVPISQAGIDPVAPSPYPYWVEPEAPSTPDRSHQNKCANDFGATASGRAPLEGTGVDLNRPQKRAFQMASTSKDDEAASDRIRTISRHSLAYMLCAASEMFRHNDFDPMDLIIIHAVLNANVLNIMKNPELDRRLGSVQAVEPDEIKQGVSRAALSRFLGIPIETVRRRADRLKKEGVLRETEHGLIVTEANQFKFGNNHELQKTNILLVRKFLRDLMEAGVEVPGGI
jgi:hypothetical protein